MVVATASVEPGSEELAARAAEFESAPADEIISWAVESFGHRMALACSFQECAILDISVRADPGIEVIFIDTGFHFAETLAFVEEVRALYDLNLRVVRPGPDAALCPQGSETCCQVRKVATLNRALEGHDAWMTGLKRCDSPTRSHAPIVHWDGGRGLVKINPLANWSDQDLETYIADHSLPVHPLVAQGYFSIGCAPCTAAVVPGAGRRSGRWAGSEKTECGLHI